MGAHLFGSQNITLCMRTWCEVRIFASQKFRLTPVGYPEG